MTSSFALSSGYLFVDRRFRIEQQRHQVLDLLLREGSGVTQPRHLRAQVVGLGVVDLAVGVFLDLGAVAAQFAEAKQAGTDGAVGRFLRRQLVAVVAAAAGGS